jgi:hypothetical protein
MALDLTLHEEIAFRTPQQGEPSRWSSTLLVRSSTSGS